MAKLNPMRFVGVPLPIVATVQKHKYRMNYPEGRIQFGMYDPDNPTEVAAMDRMHKRMADALVSARRGSIDIAKRKVEAIAGSDRLATRMFDLVYVAYRKHKASKV